MLGGHYDPMASNVVEMLVREFEWDYVVCFLFFFLILYNVVEMLVREFEWEYSVSFFQYLFLFHTTAMWHVCV
jgi:hypothetical protein